MNCYLLLTEFEFPSIFDSNNSGMNLRHLVCENSFEFELLLRMPLVSPQIIHLKE